MNLNVIISWVGILALSYVAICGLADALKGAGKNPSAKTSILWGAWALVVCAILFGSDLQWFRTVLAGRAIYPGPAGAWLAVGLFSLCIAVARMARDGFTSAEFAATVLGAAIAAVFGWIAQESNRTLIGLAATIGFQLVRFGAGNAQAKLADKNGRFGTVAVPAGWALTLAGAALIFAAIWVVNGGNTAGWLPEWQWRPNTTADTRAARGTAGQKTTPTPAPPPAAVKITACYRPNSDRSKVVILVPNQKNRIHELEWAYKARTYMNLTLPFILEPGGPVVDVPRCPVTANDPP